MTRWVVVLLLAVASGMPREAIPIEQQGDAKARAVALAAGLRCLVCQNQTIADSNAELAVDLRREINVQIAAGKTDGEIIDFMVTRYGDFVLYRPPFKATTLLLWVGPGLFIIVALGALIYLSRSRRARLGRAPSLSAEERALAARLLTGRTEHNK